MKRLLFIVMSICTVFLFAGCGMFGSFDEGTPEDIINAYVNAARENDTETMRTLFASDDVVAGYDAAKMAERLQVPVEQVEEYTGEVTGETRAEEISSDIMLFYVGFLDSDTLLTISSSEALAEELNALDKASLTVKRTDALSYRSYDVSTVEDAANQQFEWKKAIYGAEDCTEYTALLELDGKTYFFSAQFLKYNGEWKIFSTSSTISKNLQNFSAYSVTAPMSEADYSAMAGD